MSNCVFHAKEETLTKMPAIRLLVWKNSIWILESKFILSHIQSRLTLWVLENMSHGWTSLCDDHLDRIVVFRNEEMRVGCAGYVSVWRDTTNAVRCPLSAMRDFFSLVCRAWDRSQMKTKNIGCRVPDD